MATRRRSRDVTKGYPKSQFVAKLRRLADSIETGEAFSIQIARAGTWMRSRAVFTIEHEKAADAEEIEFQITWKPEARR
jgi:2'-5' RNA ligase